MKSAIVVALILVVASAGITPRGDRAEAADGPRSDHPFSDPVWSPLRQPAVVSCVRTNCPGPYHDYAAIDLLGDFGDPIYAAGAGIFHIGGIAPGCASGPPTRGTWVWIDHGPAGSTRYHHMDTILAQDGQYVTPATQIGTMGSSGDTSPCAGAYLHFELRDSEEDWVQQPLPDFLACTTSGIVRLPDHIGFPRWDDIPNKEYSTPFSGNGCLPTSWAQTPEQPPPVTLDPGVGSMTVRLPDPPPGVDDVRVRLQLFHPSLDEYGLIHELSAAPSAPSVTFDDLLTNRRYRAVVSQHNSVGWSAWSDPVATESGFLPHVPEFRESFSTKTTISYKWHTGANDDADHTVAIRRGDGVAWGDWEYFDVQSPDVHYRFRDLYEGALYQVTVRSYNEFGHSAFAPYHKISTVCYTVCDPPPLYLTLQPAVRVSLQE
jgi:hypothetical protein